MDESGSSHLRLLGRRQPSPKLSPAVKRKHLSPKLGGSSESLNTVLNKKVRRLLPGARCARRTGLYSTCGNRGLCTRVTVNHSRILDKH